MSDRGGPVPDRLRDGATRVGRALGARALGARRLEPGRVVFNSFQGRFSDNPRAIHEELVRRGAAVEPVWMCRPGREAEFPSGVAKAAPATWDLVRRVQRAKTIVANVEMRENLHKRRGMVFLQTWHGTPLKTIAYDNRYVIANPAGFVRDIHEYRRWDYVLSPNAFSTEILRRAFRGFEGEMLETGYPRNDVLSSPGRDAVRARVRAVLGAEDGQTVVLYAPTWRDNLFHEQGPASYRLELDLDALGRALGEDHMILLRLHFLVAAGVGDTAGADVRNVSDYTDIRDLYLASDVMITDYSSAMFDFAITGKPIVFFTYDLEHYRDEMRGFYFDFEPAAPGPLCRTTDEVISVLKDRNAALRPYGERYARFRERFCHLDDGHASARVVERLFGDLLP